MRFGIFYIVLMVTLGLVAKVMIPTESPLAPQVSSVESNMECFGEGEELLCMEK
jgi:hypothetical protein